MKIKNSIIFLLCKILVLISLFVEPCLAEVVTKINSANAHFEDTIYASVKYINNENSSCDINFTKSNSFIFKELSKSNQYTLNDKENNKRICCIDFSIKSAKEIYGNQAIEPGSLIINKVEYKIPNIKINFLNEKKEKLKVIQKFSTDKIKLSETAEYLLEVSGLATGEKLALDDLSSHDFSLSFKKRLNQKDKSVLIYEFKPKRLGEIKVKDRRVYGMQACKWTTDTTKINLNLPDDSNFVDLFAAIEDKELYLEVKGISILVEE